MCQRALALVVLLAACATPPKAVAPTAPPPPKRAFVVRYREAANAFAIVDEISSWFPEKLDPEYAATWEKRFGSDPAVSAQLAAWGEVRKRWWKSETTAPDAPILGRSKPPDVLADVFYGEDNLDAALAKAAAIIGADDANVLRATFALVKPKLDVLLGESRVFLTTAPKLQARLDDPKVTAFVAELARFYRAGDIPPFNVEYIWWPPIDSSTANVYGDTLLLRYDPTTDVDNASSNVDVPLHEVAHFASVHQPEAQKVALSQAFIAKCGVLPKAQPVRLFEEALAVAHQKMFLAQNDPARFDRERPWYGDPWASVSAKMIYDAVVTAHAEHRVLDERIALAAGRSCRELSALTR
jgi:hypothetical protein